MKLEHFLRRFLAPLICLLLLGTVLAACGGGQPEAQPQPQGEQPQGEGNKIFMPITSGSQPGEQPPAADTGLSVAQVSTSLAPKMGETFTITATVTGANQPYFYLMIQDSGAPEGVLAAQVEFSGAATLMQGASGVFEMVSASGSNEQVVFVVKALASGSASLWVRVVDADQKAGQSQPISITVSD